MRPGDRIEQDVHALTLPAGRRVGGPGHAVARHYVRRRLEEIGLFPFKGDSFELPYTQRHPVTGRPTEFVNLVGIARGTESGSAPILVGAHYDSVIDAPCADDNATAVAVVLAVAEGLVEARPRRDVIIAIFDAEEPPFFYSDAMGSTRFYEDECQGRSFACAIIMDLIGHDVENNSSDWDGTPPDLRNLLVVMGAESDRALPGIVECAALRVVDLQILPTQSKYLLVDMSDYHAFREGCQPFLFLTCGMGRNYHTAEDSLCEDGWINMDKVRRVHRFVVALVACADGAEGPSLDKVAPLAETVDFEIRMIHRALGTPLPLAAKGLPLLSTRMDVDEFAEIMMPILLPPDLTGL